MHSKLSKVRLWKFNKDLTIKSQILIISLWFSTLILGILLGAVFISQILITDALREASNKIFRLQTKAYLNIVWLHQHRMEEQIASTMQKLGTIREINTFVQKQIQNGGQFTIPQPKMCLLNETQRDSYSLNNSICCGIFGTPLNKIQENQLQSFMITTSLVDIFRQEYEFSSFSPMSFQYNNSAQYYCFSFGLAFPSTFKPQKRSYYIETLQQMNNQSDPEAFYFTRPFFTLYKHVRCPMTTALLDLNNQFVGLVQKDLDFDSSQIQKSTIQTLTSYVIANDGLVVFTAVYKIDDQPAFYLNESKYTGFAQQDFEQIMLKHHGQPFQSNCLNFEFVDILCRYNVLTQNNVIIRTANITTSPYIMVIVSDTNVIKEEETAHLEFLDNKLKELIQRIIFTISISTIGSIVLGYLSLSIILRQLNNVNYKMNKLMHQNRFNLQQNRNFKSSYPIWDTRRNQFIQLQKLFKFSIFQSRLVTQLTHKIVKLFNFINHEKKCSECKQQEKLQYPKAQPVQTKNLDGIRLSQGPLKNLKNLPRQIKGYLRFSIKNIIRLKELISNYLFNIDKLFYFKISTFCYYFSRTAFQLEICEMIILATLKKIISIQHLIACYFHFLHLFLLIRLLQKLQNNLQFQIKSLQKSQNIIFN